MSRAIRVGLLSVAHYHGHFWAEAFRESPLAEFVGIWDDDPTRGEEAAARHGVRFWTDLDALLGACEAVGITSATVQHARLGAGQDPAQLVERLGGERIHRADALELYAIDRRLIGELAARLERRLAFGLSISDGDVYLSIGSDTLTGSIVRHRLG